MERYGNTDSMPPSHASCSSARSSVSPAATNEYSSVVSPTSLTSTRLDTAGNFALSASSMMKEP